MTKKKPDETKSEADTLCDSDEENKTKNINNNNNDAKTQVEGVGKDKKNALIDLGHYKPAFRELDIEVETLTSIGLT